MKTGAVHTCVFFEHVIRWGGTWDRPLFVHRDICLALGISAHRDAYDKLEDYDKGGRLLVDSPGGQQEMVTLTESGLFTLILRSRKPAAKAFQKWIVTEVLPSIRKTGGYGQPVLTAEEREVLFLPPPAGILGSMAMLTLPSGRRAPDLMTEHVGDVLHAAIGHEAQWAGTIRDLAAIAIRDRKLFWIVRDLADARQLSHLGKILSRRVGIYYVGFGVTHIYLTVVGKYRGRRYLVMRKEGALS